MSDHSDELEPARVPEPAPERPRGLPPVAIPIVALFGMLILVFSASRILLAVSHAAASAIALFLALNVLAGAALVSAGKWVRNRPASFPMIVLSGLLVVAGGAMALAIGPQEHEEERFHVTVVAEAVAFVQTDVRVPPDEPIAIEFENRDAGTQHNVSIFEGADATAPNVFRGEVFPGVATRTYEVEPLAAGEYFFQCDVHPNMTGTITVEEGASPPAPGSPPAGPTPGPSPAETTPAAPTGEPDVVAEGVEFTTDQVTATAEGGRVALVFQNLDAVPHNMVVVDGEDSDGEQIFDGELVTADSIEYAFEVPRTGDFFFYCKVHPQMTGTLTVE
jgi:plastocyanin